ncbi:MAG: DUF2911 domain-containing protein [Crocinitomicaceae bacterium]
MKNLSVSLGVVLLLAACGSNNEEQVTKIVDSTAVVQEVSETETLPEKKKPKSPRMQSTSQVNGSDVTIDYGSPFVKGRTIWGELVPFNKVWRAGANETTKLVLSDDMKIAGKEVKAGTYGLLIEPKTEGSWTVILNTAWDYDKHGIWGSNGYKEENDVVRLEIAPTFVDELQESLTFSLDEGNLSFAWEYARFELNIAK